VILAVGLMGCRTEGRDDAHTDVFAEPALPGIEFDSAGKPLDIPAEFTLDYARSGCLGPCPVYEIQIRGDGTGDYSGSYCVEDPGPEQLTVTAHALEDLVVRLGALRFFELQARYDAVVEHLPHSADVVVVTIRVTSGGQTASLRDAAGDGGRLPSWWTVLRELEVAIPAAANVDAWVGHVPWGDTDAGASCAQP
jgi:hypothetical protein